MSINFSNSNLTNIAAIGGTPGVSLEIGTVTSVTAGAGLAGGTITSAGTLSLETLSPSPAGGITNANIQVDAYGRITSASVGSSVSTVSPFIASLDQYATIVLPLSGTPGQTSFEDIGVYTASVANGGTVVISDSHPVAPIGISSSAYFPKDGGSYLAMTSAPSYTVGTGDFTIEMWVYITAQNPEFIVFSDLRNYNGTRAPLTALNSDYTLGFYDGYDFFSSTNITITYGQWHHLCWMRKDGVLYFFANGVVDSNTPALTYNMTANTPTLGTSIERSPTSYASMTGYISNFRFSNGLARYSTSGFSGSLPTSAFPAASSLTFPSSPIAGQFFISDNDKIYICTDATGPVWKYASLSSI